MCSPSSINFALTAPLYWHHVAPRREQRAFLKGAFFFCKCARLRHAHSNNPQAASLTQTHDRANACTHSHVIAPLCGQKREIISHDSFGSRARESREVHIKLICLGCACISVSVMRVASHSARRLLHFTTQLPHCLIPIKRPIIYVLIRAGTHTQHRTKVITCPLSYSACRTFMYARDFFSQRESKKSRNKHLCAKWVRAAKSTNSFPLYQQLVGMVGMNIA